MKSEPLQPIRRFSIAMNVVLQLGASLLLMIFVNVLGYRHNWRWDLTRNQDYTLSDQTKNHLKNLHGKTEIIAAFTRGTDEDKEVRALLDEYRRQGKSHVSIEFLDLARNPSRKVEIEQKFNFAFNKNGILVSKETVAKPKAVAPTDGTAPVPTTPPSPAPEAPVRRSRFLPASQLFGYEDLPGQPRRLSDFSGESLITSALIGTNEKKSPVVYLLTGNIGDLPAAKGVGGNEYTAQNIFQDIANKQDVDLRTLNLTSASEVPDDASALISLRADLPFNAREMALIHDYWEQKKGAGLLVLLDPKSDQSRLDVFLADNGILPRNDRVLKLVPGVQGPHREFEVPAAFVPGSTITQPLGTTAVTLPEQTKSLKIEDDPQKLRAASLEVTPLIAAHPEFWGETRFADEAPRKDDDEVGYPSPVIAAASSEKGAQKDQRLGFFSSRLVVVGNAALLDPDRDTCQVSPAAYDFISCSLNWILNREDLIGGTSKKIGSYNLRLSSEATGKILWLCVGLLPGAVMMFALFMWSTRRA